MAVWWSVFLPPFVLSSTAVAGLLLYTFRFFFAIPHPKVCCNKEVPDDAAASPSKAHLGNLEAGIHRGITADFKAHSFSWVHIWFKITSPVGLKDLLRGCSGEVFPGEMAAIIGPSGAGKSTLLDILAMRIKQTSGDVLVDGVVRDPNFKKISTYLPQEESFVPTLTVWETLGLNSRLRLPMHIKPNERRMIMGKTLEEMGLFKVKDSQVGGMLPGGLHVRGISGGERRRLHICCGIVAAPSIIFLDEPTSGLDSHASLVLMEHMKKLAGMGRTVICSIHQPRLAIWDLFDKVEVLSEGYLLYFGATLTAAEWFNCSLNLAYDPTKDGTFSDWLLDVISISFTSSQSQHVVGLQSLPEVAAAAKKYSDEGLSANVGKQALERGLSSAGDSGAEQTFTETQHRLLLKPLASTYPTPFGNQLVCLMWRAMMSYIRNPADVAGRLLLALGIGVLAGLAYFNSNTDGQGVLPVTYTLNFAILFILLSPYAQMSLYVADRQFYLTDVAANLYSPFAYYLAVTLTATPFNVVGGLVLFLLVYGLVGLKLTAGAILVSCAAVAIFSLIAIQTLVVNSYIMPNQDLAFVGSTGYVVLCLLCSGFPIPLRNLIGFLRGISYITYVRYCSQILVREQFLGTSRASLLSYFDMKLSNGFNFLGLILIYLALQFCTYVALWRLAARVRR